MDILLTGGTGFIGNKLTKELLGAGHNLTILSRTKTESSNKNIKYIQWDKEALRNAVNASDIVINLAGEPVTKKRWTREQKNLLSESRILTTRLIANAINSSDNKPEKLINASAVGIYGNRYDEKITEGSSLGSDFLANICKEWEAEANKAKTKVIVLRIGIVIGKGGGALERMITPFKLCLGGPLGTGKQWMPWIAIDDVIGIIKFATENEAVTGAFNLTAPNPVTNKEFAGALGKVLHRPSFAPVPEFALKILLGEMANLLLSGQKAIPERITGLGYKFKHAKLEDALKNTLNGSS